MKTTLVIDDKLLDRLREEAARRGTTLSALVESALRMFLDLRRERPPLPPLPSFDGGERWSMLPTGVLSTTRWKDADGRAFDRRFLSA